MLNPESFSYDKTGNRTSNGGAFNSNNELTATATATYSYDNNGNTKTKTVSGLKTTYGYDARDRLARVQLPDGTTAIYAYDPFGRRVSKTVAGVTTYYLYSEEGLVGEYAADGTLLKEYGWQPDGIWGTNPVFQQTGGSYYFYHNDHLGTPLRLTDGNGNTVWQASYEAFGKATVNPTSTITNNLRFPGQYWDEETNLHYNWQRYYDPETGKYTQTDLLGFGAGDANLYRYVGNGPSYYIDPFGLFSEDIIGGDDLSQYVDTNSDTGGSEAASLLLDFIPVISEIKGLAEMVVGKNLLTGECLGNGRYLALLGPVAKVGKVAKLGSKAYRLHKLQKIKKARQILKANRAAGKAAEELAAIELKAEGNIILGSQVSVRTSEGRRVVDHLIQTPDTRSLPIRTLVTTVFRLS